MRSIRNHIEGGIYGLLIENGLGVADGKLEEVIAEFHKSGENGKRRSEPAKRIEACTDRDRPLG